MSWKEFSSMAWERRHGVRDGMQATLLTPDERTVIDAVDGGECALPADLDDAVHSLEERGWIALLARGAVIDGEREYTLGLTPYGRAVRRDLASPTRASDRPRRAGSDPQRAGSDPRRAGSDPRRAGSDPEWNGPDPTWNGPDP